MPDLSRRRSLAALAGLTFSPWLPAIPNERLTADQLRADVDFIGATLAATHPDLAFSTDPAAVATALATLAASAPDGLTRDEAWLRLATLNPLFADAHVLVGYAGWRAAVRAHLAGGGTLFPYRVALDDGSLVIRSLPDGAPTPLQGARIVSIDGQPADTVVATLLARMHGDTPLFRTHLLAQRWWFYHWKLAGAPRGYRLTLAQAGRTWTVETPGSNALPAPLRAEESFDEQYRLDFAADGSAVLTMASFAPADPARVQAFTRAAFASLRERACTKLTIDVSANGGGDDAVWLDGLLPYLATRPYRTGSTYRKKVLETNEAKGERAGAVVRGEIATWYQPQPDNPLRFKGQVLVAIGPATYSSAVLFANVMRDFGFAILTGTGNAARRAQSGGVRSFTLPHSGLLLSVPRFVLEPPGGAAPGALLAL
ncbi:S41 family peptidase [Pseudoduganella armeniaca]|uniref:Tail specific protease domain-containing protein n=1 Tax=Pseudoduganella armeniaca TaxID=2072590 RepID=A0A2R4C6P9_9BURK|nr:S41 family peptidase [Pseudoduganella armeniaca]AVR95284.1 hypothetical protein C9I28_05750 [Pseudoduganella armeniaca]